MKFNCLLTVIVLSFLSVANGKDSPLCKGITTSKCEYNLKCLYSIFLNTFKPSETVLFKTFGQPDQSFYDSTIVSGEFMHTTHLSYSCFSISFYKFKSFPARLEEVSIKDSAVLSYYGFTKGMPKESLRKLIPIESQDFNQKDNYVELAYFTDEDRYYFRFIIRNDQLESLIFSEYQDE